MGRSVMPTVCRKPCIAAVRATDTAPGFAHVPAQQQQVRELLDVTVPVRMLGDAHCTGDRRLDDGWMRDIPEIGAEQNRSPARYRPTRPDRRYIRLEPRRMLGDEGVIQRRFAAGQARAAASERLRDASFQRGRVADLDPQIAAGDLVADIVAISITDCGDLKSVERSFSAWVEHDELLPRRDTFA
jgi:hypothetical protein